MDLTLRQLSRALKRADSAVEENDTGTEAALKQLAAILSHYLIRGNVASADVIALGDKLRAAAGDGKHTDEQIAELTEKLATITEDNAEKKLALEELRHRLEAQQSINLGLERDLHTPVEQMTIWKTVEADFLDEFGYVEKLSDKADEYAHLHELKDLLRTLRENFSQAIDLIEAVEDAKHKVNAAIDLDEKCLFDRSTLSSSEAVERFDNERSERYAANRRG